jgi:hypothetical protein
VTDDRNRKLRPEVVAGLEARGPDTVRILLAIAPPSVASKMDGLHATDDQGILRADAELWLRRKDARRAAILAQKEADQAASQARRDAAAWWFNWATILLGLIAAAGAIVAAWEGRATIGW